MSQVVVTGGCGFIGSHLVRGLLAAGHDVVVLDDLSGGFTRNLPVEYRPGYATSAPAAGCEFIRGSVTDADLVDQLIRTRRPRYVYHLAAYAAEGLSHFIRGFNYANNVLGSMNVVNACVRYGVQRLVFTSSIAVYGHAVPPFYETSTPTPADPYGIAKYAVELDLAAAHRMFGLEYTVFRPHNVYGERQHIGDRYRNVVGIFMNQLLQGQPLTIFGDGEQKRAFSHVGDIIGPMVSCTSMADACGQTFNVGGELPYTVNQLATTLMRVTGRPAETVHLPARQEAVNAYSNHDATRAVFGEEKITPLDIGLDEMWRWAKGLGPQTPTLVPSIEVDKNMPPSWRG